MRSRARYWSNTKFADWLRGTPKPLAETSEGWDQWRSLAKANHALRFWLAEEGLDIIQDVVHWPTDQLHSVKYWINNRFVTKTHALTSTLPRGTWHEFDTRLLHCAFDELVNFVEVELAWSNIAWDSESRKKYKPPFYAYGWFRWRTWKSPEAGLEYLRWASSLTNEEWLPDGEKDKAEPTQQAIVARETLELYNWWKVVRPARPDPHDASGWSALCDERRQKHGGPLREEKTAEEREQTRKALDLCTKIEYNYDKEDEEMLIRLIKIRKGLWT